ncbi:MAG TPA: lysophospholipase [Solirubrobacteraceae bacterium]|nr:lysophospholipase [Solirubrobacteraceae bacterium]
MSRAEKTHRDGELSAADGVRLRWQAWLPEREPAATVLLLHGGAEHGGRYPHLVSRLVGEGYAVYAPDLRGHGRSGGRRGSVTRFSDYTDDVAIVVDALALGPPLFVLGYSLGGLVGAMHALDHQDELAGVILAGPALGVGDGVSPLQFRLARTLAALTPRLPVFRMDPPSMMRDPAVVREYEADPLVFHRRFDAGLIGQFVTAMAEYPDRITALTLPLLVLHGDADVTANPAGSRMTIERAASADKTLRTYAGVTHDIFNDPDRDRAIDDVTAWLRTRTRTRPAEPPA